MNLYKLCLVLALTILLLATFSYADVVTGRVISVQGDFIETDVGSSSGITAGDTGRVYYMVTVVGVERPVYLAKIKVTYVSSKSCVAKIEDKTGEVKVYHLVEIEVKEGGLVVRSEPSEANIKINEKTVGKSPYEGKGFPPGSYRINVEKEDYEVWEKQVTVEGSKTTEVFAQLRRKEPKPDEAWRDPTTGIEFVYVKGGCFEMGCGSWTSGCKGREKPIHEVCVGNFWMGKYKVTQGQWEKVMSSNPSHFKRGGDYPVEMVSWNEVQEFLQRLNQKSDKRYRLPTEAEWEYAARSGGKHEKWAGTSTEYELGNYAWYSSNSGRETHPVGQKTPNGLGLYDMSGNLFEWVLDWFGSNYYRSSPRENPTGPSSGTQRVLRGGSWFDKPGNIRASNRLMGGPSYRFYDIGFRLVLSSE